MRRAENDLGTGASGKAKRRILFVSTSTTIGGAEKTVHALATSLDAEKFAVCGAVSLKPKGPYAEALEAAGIRTWSLDVRERAGFGDLRRLAAVVHEAKPDVVHAVMYQAIQLCRAVRRLGYADFKLISSPRVTYRTRAGLSLWIDAALRKADDALVAESEASRRFLVDKLGYAAEKVLTIRNGIAPFSMDARAERARRRAELGVSEGTALMGCVGRLDEQKGQAYFLEAVAKLKALHPVKAVIIGQGPLEKSLKELARSLGIEEDAVFLGERRDVPSWLAALDVFVQPSLWEGLPNTLLEAMALGLPVVATRVDGIPELIADDVSGLLAEPKDSQALYVPLQDLIVSPELRRRLGEGARQVVLENFQLRRMLAEYEALYARVGGEA